MYHAVRFAQLPFGKSLEDIVPALAYYGSDAPAWKSTVTYVRGQLVIQNDIRYVSLQNNNLNRSPAANSSWWKDLTSDISARDSWEDWHLVPNERPSFQPPPVKTNYQGLDGTDTTIDLTTAVAGYVPYDRRTGSWEWHVVNDYGHWATRYSEIMNFLQQREIIAWLEDDPFYYYKGRFSVNQWRSDPERSKIVIDYSVMPYKYEIISSNNAWLWDPFSFVNGVIRTQESVSVSDGTGYVTIVGSESPWQPSFVISGIPSGGSLTIVDEHHTTADADISRTVNSNGEFVFSNIVIRPLESDQDSAPAWNNSTVYSKGDVAKYQKRLYKNLVNNNLGNNPLTATSYWTPYRDEYGNNLYRIKLTGTATVLIKYRGGSL